MNEIVHCKDCKYMTYWRSGESAEKYGKGMECSIDIIDCPDDYDFCSKGKRAIRCEVCGKRFDKRPNYCPNCGARMVEPQESEE